MGYRVFKDLTRRTASDKIFRDKALMLPKIQNMIKKLLVGVLKMRICQISN